MRLVGISDDTCCRNGSNRGIGQLRPEIALETLKKLTVEIALPIQITRHFHAAVLAAALLTTLTACGGGGSDAPDLPCGGGNPLSVALTYEVNGVLVDGNRPITLARNVPVVATPRIVGLPSACNGATHLSVKTVVTSGLPNGVEFDAKTGVLSGTPTARVGTTWR